MKVLILDDQEVRHQSFAKIFSGCELTHSYTYAEAVTALQAEVYDWVCLDHDIHDGSWTGYHVAMFITQLDQASRPHTVLVHSWNPEGADRMTAALLAAGIQVFRRPFSDT